MAKKLFREIMDDPKAQKALIEARRGEEQWNLKQHAGELY